MKIGSRIICILLAAVLLCGCVAHQLELWVEGICLVTDNGSVLLVAKDEPIVLNDRSADGQLLTGLQTGDRVRVLHDGIAESFPARASIYRLEKLGQGSLDEISPHLLDTLRDMGWIS